MRKIVPWHMRLIRVKNEIKRPLDNKAFNHNFIKNKCAYQTIFRSYCFINQVRIEDLKSEMQFDTSPNGTCSMSTHMSLQGAQTNQKYIK